MGVSLYCCPAGRARACLRHPQQQQLAALAPISPLRLLPLPCPPQVRAGSRRAESKGVAAQEVAQVIYEALTVEQPRARYLIGKEARLQMLFRRLLPDRMWDPLLMNSLSKMG